MLRLSGRIADGVVLSGGLSSEFVRHSLSFVEEERVKTGRAAEPFVKSAYVYFLATETPGTCAAASGRPRCIRGEDPAGHTRGNRRGRG